MKQPFIVLLIAILFARCASLTVSRGTDDVLDWALASTESVLSGTDGTLDWVVSAGGPNDDEGRSIAIDKQDGSVLITGYFHGPATFGDVSTVDAAGEHVFLAKYFSNNSLVWVMTAEGENTAKDTSRGYGIAVNNEDGSVLVTGSFTGTVKFGDGAGEEITSKGESDIFLAKYRSNGALEWVKRAGGTNKDEGLGVAIDEQDGSILVTGYINGQVTFGDMEHPASDDFRYSDIFLAKYGSDGSLVWVKRTGSRGNDEGRGVAVGKDGTIAITGIFEDDAIFGENEPKVEGSNDIFLARYYSDGSLDWVETAGGTGKDCGESVSIDSRDGSIVVSGSIYNRATFGDGVRTGPGKGLEEIFLAKYHTNGTFDWVRTAGGKLRDFAHSVAIDSRVGSILITGSFHGSASFYDETGDIEVGDDSGEKNIFLAKYHSNGTLDWALNEGGADDEGYGIAIGPDGRATITGSFQGPIQFGGSEQDQRVYGKKDIFIAKYDIDIGCESGYSYEKGLCWCYIFISHGTKLILIIRRLSIRKRI